MWFKNLQLFRLPAPWHYTAEQLEAALPPQSFVPATSNELLRQGWAPPRPNGPLVHVVNRQYLIQLRTEKKLLPASVVTQVAKARAEEMEEAQGFAPGRKAMKELKERVADELLPRAFSIQSSTWAWVDTVNGWLVIDAATGAKADEVVKLLLKAVDHMPLESLRVQHSPVATMTAWLEMDEAPTGFTVDQDTELRATGESKAAIRYVKHALEPDDIRRHIKAGKQCTRLAMTWDSKISFVLTEGLDIKGIKPLDVITENESATCNDEERFDNDFMLMTGELAKMLDDLVESLGGEARESNPVTENAAAPKQSAVGQKKLERAVVLTAELYKVRDSHREVLNELYEQTVAPYITKLREQMAATGEGAITAAIELAKALPTGASGGEMFLVAAVEIMEPISGAAPAHSVNGATLGDVPVGDGSEVDPLYEQAQAVVLSMQRASISLVQRHLRIGYNRAARLLEAMETKGVVSAMHSNGNRDIIGRPA